ncbi:unnamed protein product, partial [Tenebrio molitor]
LLSSKAKRRKIYPHRPDWWNSKIERRRKIYLAKKSLLYKNRDPDKKQFLAEEMARAKTSFKSLLRKEQERSWTSFVKKDLGENPWGVVYKLATEKFNRLGALASFEKGNQHTLSPEESMSFLLESVSNEAAGVIAGIPPLDLVLAQVNCKKVLRKVEETHFLQQNLNRREFDNPSQIKEYLSLLVNDHWQYRWENSQKGRTTYAFIPTVPESPRHSFTRESTQTLTGHGNFQVHLHRIGKKREDDLCETCEDESDDPRHRILHCPRYLMAQEAINEEL